MRNDRKTEEEVHAKYIQVFIPYKQLSENIIAFNNFFCYYEDSNLPHSLIFFLNDKPTFK